MIFSLSRSQRGWVSLPIIALLLAVSALSVRYQEDLLAAYQWRGQLSDIEEEQKFWTAFQSEFVASPSFSSALDSECVGFCDLLEQQESDQEKTWQYSNQTFTYQWSRYEGSAEEESSSEPESSQTSYRLCATQNQQVYLCWWWRDGKLLSNGSLSVN